MPGDVSGNDRVEVVGESFYRAALQRVADRHDPADPLSATLSPDPENPYDRNAVRVEIDGEQVGHFPRELAALVAAPITAMARSGPVTAKAELRGDPGSELGCGVVLSLDLVCFDLVTEEEEVIAGDDIGNQAEIPEGPAVVASSRRTTIERAIERWKNDLIDLSGRNRLLYLRDLTAGTLSFDASARGPLMDLVAGKRVALSRVVPRSKPRDNPAAKLTPFDDSVRRTRTILRTARTYEEERGVRTLFLACGVATWRNDKASRPPAAPVLLVPLAIKPRGASQQDFDLSLAGELEVNPTLLHLLKVEFNLNVDDRELYEHSEMDGVIDTPEELRLAFDWLARRCERVPDWSITDRFVIGNFWYAKLPMVKDLEASVDSLAAHDVASAMAGDAAARSAVFATRANRTKARENVDELAPASEFNILDADSSQSLAIARARAGVNLVLRGPPGTGKSQTIANLICAAVGERKRVLFVAEKRAAIEAVTKRLDKVDLDGIVLDLHRGSESRKWLASQLGQSLEAIGSTAPVASGGLDSRLERSRATLREHAEALHTKNKPWDLSVFDAQMGVLDRGRPSVSARLRGADLERVDEQERVELGAALGDLLVLKGLSLKANESPWADANIDSAAVAREAEGLLADVALSQPKLEAGLTAAIGASGLPLPSGLAQASELIGLWGAVRACSEAFDPGIFGSDLAQTTIALQPLGGSGFSRLAASIGSSEFRAARAFIRENLRPGVVDLDPHQLLAQVEACRDAQLRWKERCAGDNPPSFPADSDALQGRVVDLETSLRRIEEISTLELLPLDFQAIAEAVAALAGDRETLFALPRISALRESFAASSLSGFLVELEANQALLADAEAEWDRVWWQSLADHLMGLPAADELVTFRGDLHARVASEFKALDRDHVAASAQHVRRVAAEAAIAAQDEFPDQAQLVRAQAKRKRGHMPVRELFARAPDVVTGLRPCWVMSPLMVSQLIPSGPAYFDLVIFDEASQVRPVDALTSMIRGNQLVVAGDEHQLPPTAFFDSAASGESEADSEEETTDIADYESLLDVLLTLFDTEMLRWHYRSRDERLIGFSNREIYEGGLTTFPGVVSDDVLRHVLVDTPPEDGESRVSPRAEVDRVVELVIEHATNRPGESLGVIALGIQHADAIDAGLLAALPAHPELESFFAEDREERFFVKNLERVQGDERDAIILAIGYGKAPDGTLPHRFGPLNVGGGERRLNVAVTRAKRRMIVVSSFEADEIDTRRSSAEGVRLLQAFLAYAGAGGEAREMGSEFAAATPVHRQIAKALDSGGLESQQMLGASSDRIDVAVLDPKNNLPRVAIEMDGAAYAGRPSVRDRDRLRAEQLERLGWRHVSTWSQDWYRDPAGASAALVEQVQAALRQDDLEVDPVATAIGSGENGHVPSGTELERSQRPSFPAGRAAITDWPMKDLIKLGRWIESDGRLRTREELQAALMDEIGIKRKGSRVVRVLEEVAEAVREQSTG